MGIFIACPFIAILRHKSWPGFKALFQPLIEYAKYCSSTS